MASYYVSMESIHGAVTTSMFRSREDFESWYAGSMMDGSSRTIRSVYPKIHYQGPDEMECRRITGGRNVKKLQL
ncbi:MAG: hypothetical protein HY367_03190 [Candidatus Aenigmarchaeota archaeon]|nr:hypothetical protein [Candidatus Aenigmarchaeota archaeon]